MRRFTLLFLFVSVLSLASGFAETDFPLINPSFESPALSEGDSWYGAVDGWGTVGGVGTTWALPWNPSTPTTDGNQHVWADLDDFQLYQQVGTIASDTRYTFEIDLMFLEDNAANSAIVVIEETDDWIAVMDMVAYRPSWEPSREDIQIAPQEWTRVRATFDSSRYPDLVGRNMRIRVQGYHMAVDNARFFSGVPAPRDYYVSATEGDDANDGAAPETAWQTFANFNGLLLYPGDRVLLKRGDEWRDELHLRGKGESGQPIELGCYGDALLPRPRIRRYDVEYDRCAVIEGPSFWEIHSLDLRNAKIGLYLRYAQDYENQSVSVYDCHIEGLTDATLDPSKHNYEIAWSTAIYIGGKIGGPPGDPNNERTVVDGVSVTDCTFRECAHGFGNGFYYNVSYKGRLRNIYMADCIAWDCLNGAFAFFDVDTGLFERIRAIGGGGKDTWSGTALSFLQSCRNITVDNCEFAWIDRADSADGVGFDFEGDNDNCVFSNNVIHDCSGAAMLSLSTNGTNNNLTYRDCTFYNNARDPWNDEGASELYCGNSSNTGAVNNMGLYTGWHAQAAISSHWDGHTMTDIRTASFETVYNRPTWWNFDNSGDLEGWGGENQLGSVSVNGGALRATSTGDDPYIYSAPTWTPALATPYVWVRMSQTAGSHAQVFWITETDGTWDGAKSTALPINADGAVYDYFFDLIEAGAKGVITQVRLDPTIATGSDMVIEHVRLAVAESTRQGPSAPRPDWPQVVTLTGETSDGYIAETAQNSQTGGATDSGSATLRVGDDANNGSYRAITSFDTSLLPDDVWFLDATLALRRDSVVGKDPWTYGGPLTESDYCVIDLDVPHFGSSEALESGDWEDEALLSNVGRFVIAFADGLQVRDQLTDEALAAIDTTGRTQFRLRFPGGTNGDNTADYVAFGAANHSTASYRPTLTLSYLDSPPVLDAPTVPTELEVTDATTTTMTVWWTDNANNEDGFRLWDGGASVDVEANSWSHQLIGLGPNTAHDIQVAAFNSAGQSAILGPTTAWTRAAVAGAPVLSSATANSIDVAIAAGDGNPAGTHYAVQVSPAAGPNTWVHSSGVAGASADWKTAAEWGTTTVTGLASATNYTFTVVSRNGAGIESSAGPGAALSTLDGDAPPLLLNNTGAPCDGASSVVITPAMLQATDTESAASQIVFTLTAIPTAGELRLSSTVLAGGNSFTQDDIDAGNLSYLSTVDENLTDGFSFVVSDHGGNSLAEATFTVTVTKVDSPTPIPAIPALSLVVLGLAMAGVRCVRRRKH